MAIWAYIYKITNEDEGEAYIGSTTLKPPQRWAVHKSTPPPKMKHLKGKMHTFHYELLEYGFFDNKHELLIREDYYMDKFNTVFNGYNSRYNIDYAKNIDFCKRLGPKTKA